VGLDLKVLALADLVALYDLLGVDLVAGFGVDLPVLDPVAGVLVDLVKADLLSLAARRKKGDGTRDQGQLQIALPICARCHVPTPYNRRCRINRYGSRRVPNPGWRTVRRRNLRLRCRFVLRRRARLKLRFRSDSPVRRAMVVAALKLKPRLKMFHATVHV